MPYCRSFRRRPTTSMPSLNTPACTTRSSGEQVSRATASVSRFHPRGPHSMVQRSSRPKESAPWAPLCSVWPRPLHVVKPAACTSLPTTTVRQKQRKPVPVAHSYTEVRAHDDLKLWPNVEDPATQHTMSARIVQILETYRRLYKETGKEQPFLKNAR